MSVGLPAWIALLLAPLLAPLLALSGPVVAARPMQILTTDVPPLAFAARDGKPTGFCVEVVEEIQRRIGDHAVIELQPWARAYQTALSRPDVILACPKRTPEREAAFKWVGPLRVSSFNFYMRREPAHELRSLDDAKKADGVLVVRESFIERQLIDAGFTNLHPVNTSAVALRMLLAGRSALMAIDHEQLQMLLSPSDPAAKLKRILGPMPSQSYLAFPKDTPKAALASWQHALDAMKADGSYARLHKKWFPLEAVPSTPLRRGP